MTCPKVPYTGYAIARDILRTLRELGWLRGTWRVVECRVCGRLHLERIRQ